MAAECITPHALSTLIASGTVITPAPRFGGRCGRRGRGLGDDVAELGASAAGGPGAVLGDARRLPANRFYVDPTSIPRARTASHRGWRGVTHRVRHGPGDGVSRNNGVTDRGPWSRSFDRCAWHRGRPGGAESGGPRSLSEPVPGVRHTHGGAVRRTAVAWDECNTLDRPAELRAPSHPETSQQSHFRAVRSSPSHIVSANTEGLGWTAAPTGRETRWEPHVRDAPSCSGAPASGGCSRR